MIDLESEELNDDLVLHHELTVDPKQKPVRIDKFLIDRLEKVSRNRIQNGIKNGMILVNNETIKSNYKIRPKDRITIILDRPLSDAVPPVPQDIPLDIYYEDEDVLVINKPAGLVGHPGISNYSGTLVNALAYHFKDLPVAVGDPQNRLGLVHRIDKDTSGLLVIAKTTAALTHLSKQFFNHTIYRRYIALIWGEPEPPEGTIHNRLGRNPKDRKKMMVYDDSMDGGKESVTHYEVLESLYYVSLIEFRLETGRTHQIRVHMSNMGHPIFSDERYGGDKVVKGTVFSKYKQFVFNCFKEMPRQALHARSLGFIHPTTGEEMIFHSELPDDFQTVLEKWQKYVESRKLKLDLE
jgi:23S rRNA pseudouridine1911/1915/1917 synthase